MNTPSRMGMLGIGFCIGFAVAAAWFLGAPSAMQDTLPNTVRGTDNTTLTLIPDEESKLILVSNQPAGNTVVIDSIRVPETGTWVAVHEMRETELGNVLGAARTPSTASATTIPLLRDTKPGRQYAVVLYRDNGDNLFSLADDSVYVDFGTGKRVSVSFHTIP